MTAAKKISVSGKKRPGGLKNMTDTNLLLGITVVVFS